MKKRKASITDFVILSACILFYLIWFVADGVTFSNDSLGYINAVPSREPLYPTFLALFRFCFPADFYLKAAVFCQCILAAFATYRLTVVLKRKLELSSFSAALILGVQFAVVLLCRLVATRQATYCNEICSEGLSIPLFSLFMTELLCYIWQQKTHHLFWCAFYAVCLICTRKQMYIVIPVMAAVFILQFLAHNFSLKKTVCVLAVAGITVFASLGADLLYNYCMRGEAVRHTTDSSAAVITLVYSSGIEEADYFEEDGIRELYRQIMTTVEQEGYNYKFAGGNWIERYIHYSDHYDLISYGVLNDMFYQYIDSELGLSGYAKEQAFDELNHVFIKTLLPARWKKFLQVSADNMLAGLCNTVSKASTKLVWYNILFGIGYIGLMIFMAVRKKKELFWLSLTVLLSVFINVAAVGVMIFAQTRYMIYNMPFVYIAMYLMLREIYLTWKSKKHKESICEK